MYVWLSYRAVSAVVCIESIPAYAGVVVHGYLLWCMSGSLAGQSLSQIRFNVRGGRFGCHRCCYDLQCFSSLRHIVHVLSVLWSPSWRCLSVGFALWADACDGLKSLECINSNL